MMNREIQNQTRNSFLKSYLKLINIKFKKRSYNNKIQVKIRLICLCANTKEYI